MMLAWLSASEITASSRPSSVSNSPPFASKQRGIEDRVFHPQKAAQPLFELLVDALRAADEAHGGHAVAEAIERAMRGFADGRVVGEAEVVVGAEVDDLAVAGADDAPWGPASTRSLL